MPHGDGTAGTVPMEGKPAGGDARGEARTQPMQHGHRPAASSEIPATLVPETGWHFLHLFYRVDRACLAGMAPEQVRRGTEQLISALAVNPECGISQLQCFNVPGHKADFGVVMAGPDLRAMHGVQIALQGSAIGPALVPTYSFYSLTEVSEYVPTADDYARILREREGLDPESSVFKAKHQSYTARLGPMNEQRLHPDFPDWPCLCFYPMSKMRQGEQNWYLLPFETRSELMSHHGRWGVTLWARNPL
jgi:peroxiredoxin